MAASLTDVGDPNVSSTSERWTLCAPEDRYEDTSGSKCGKSRHENPQKCVWCFARQSPSSLFLSILAVPGLS